jgi:hypothetical protein
MAKKAAKKPARSPSVLAADLIAEFGEDVVMEALKAEVEDAKQTEAGIINDGAAEQVEYLVTEAYFDEKRIAGIVKDYADQPSD